MSINIADAKRKKLIAKLGFIGLIVSTLILVVILILTFFPRGNDAFTIRIDTIDQAANHFEMYKEENGSPISYASAEPLYRAGLAKAENVENYVKENEGTGGPKKYVSEDYERALVYTLFLKNVSLTEEQELYFAVANEAYNAPTNEGAVSIIEYFRILIRSSIVGELDEDGNQLPDENVKNTYYGQVHSDDLKNELGNDREPIAINPASRVKWLPDGEKVTYSVFQSEGNDGYCQNFSDYRDGYLIENQKVVIPPGKTMRFSFAAYFEGDDYDCRGAVPENSYILLSLHFGIGQN